MNLLVSVMVSYSIILFIFVNSFTRGSFLGEQCRPICELYWTYGIGGSCPLMSVDIVTYRSRIGMHYSTARKLKGIKYFCGL